MKGELEDLLANARKTLVENGTLPAGTSLEARVERTRDASHGDFTSTFAMTIAKTARRKPKELAEAIVAALPASPSVAKVEIAGPGFINFFLAANAQQAVVSKILQAGDDFAVDRSARCGLIHVEFVSANPTGPMHVGHGRGAAYGDSLCNILAATGWKVHREYYINDAGRQADILALSVWLRYLQAAGEPVPHPSRAYPGDYIHLCAEHLRRADGDAHVRSAASIVADLPGDPVMPENPADAEKAAIKAGQEAYLDALLGRTRQLLGTGFDRIRERALADQLAQIRVTLTAFGVNFDQWSSEQALVSAGAVRRAMDKLEKAGKVYNREGAQWLRTSDLGDEKDRVLIKADGAATYFANDLAYHVDKLERGFPLLLDVWGADHHGYIARLRAAIEMLTGRRDALQVQLMQFVTLSSGRMGKRSGNFVTLQELIDEAGRDATRFFYLGRSHDQHLEFDIDLARAQSNDNPVYYVQYAHARICSIFRQLQEKGMEWNPSSGEQSLVKLAESHELTLLTTLSRYPEVLESASTSREPHQLAHYLVQLATDFHAYYNAHRFLSVEDDLRNARLNLCAATRVLLRNGLALLGVSAPQTM